jgi:hypothetical protein
LLAHGRCFFPATPASFTTKTGGHDIAKLLLKVMVSFIGGGNQSTGENHPSVASY